MVRVFGTIRSRLWAVRPPTLKLIPWITTQNTNRGLSTIGSAAPSLPKRSRWPWVVGIGVLLGGGSLEIRRRRLQANAAITANDVNVNGVENLRHTIRSLKSRGVDPMVQLKFTLYRYPTCPFCSMVHTYLTLRGADVTVIEVDPIFKSELQPVTAYSKVPVLAVSTADDSKPSVLVDSRAICDIIEEELPSNVLAKDHHTSPNTSATATASESNDISYAKTPLNEDDWRRWTRDVLVRVMVVNMNRSFGDAWASFSYVDTMDLTPGRKLFMKLLGGPMMYIVSKTMTVKRLRKLGYEIDANNEREMMSIVSRKWADEGLAGKNFHGGDRPSFADTDVFGVVQSLRGHILYDFVCSSSSEMQSWVERMKTEVDSPKSL